MIRAIPAKPGIATENATYRRTSMQNRMIRLNPSFLTIGFCLIFSNFVPPVICLRVIVPPEYSVRTDSEVSDFFYPDSVYNCHPVQRNKRIYEKRLRFSVGRKFLTFSSSSSFDSGIFLEGEDQFLDPRIEHVFFGDKLTSRIHKKAVGFP